MGCGSSDQKKAMNSTKTVTVSRFRQIDLTQQFIMTHCDIGEELYVRCEELEVAFFLFLQSHGVTVTETAWPPSENAERRHYVRWEMHYVFVDLFLHASTLIDLGGLDEYCAVYHGVALHTFPRRQRRFQKRDEEEEEEKEKEKEKEYIKQKME